MEEYTVDIDKVLDDFEETEALKFSNSSKNASTSLLQPSLLMNCYEENHFNVNKAETTLENSLSVEENKNHSNDKTTLLSDKDILTPNAAHDVNKYLKHLEMPDGCDAKYNCFNENGDKMLDDSHLLEQDCVPNVHLSASVSEVDREGSGQSVSLNSSNAPKCELDNDCSFTLCGKSTSDITPESHLIKENALVYLHNSSCDKAKFDKCSLDMHLVDATCEKNSGKNFQQFEETKWNFSQLDSEQSNVHQENISGAIISGLSSDKSLNDNLDEQQCETALKTDLSEPTSSVDHKNAVSKAGASAPEVEEQCSNNNSNSASDFAEESNEHNGCGHVVLPPVVIVQPEYDVISDEDSGVSSEEGNNSPLFFFNNRMFNFNDGINVDANQEAAASAEFVCPACDNEESEGGTPEVNYNSGGARSSVIITEIESTEEIPPENSAETQSSNKFTGARPKLETVNQTPVIEVCDVATEEISETENKDLELNDVCTTESLLESNETSKTSQVSRTDKCDIPNTVSDLLPVDSDISCGINSIDVRCDNEVMSNAELFSNNIENKCANLIPEVKADSLPQRLSRPTTLDLPSRHIAVTQIAGEVGTEISGSPFPSVSGTDFISNEAAVDDSASEPLPSVSQQPQIGLVKPFWIPDSDAPNCMHCGIKFNVIKRRHHCRACGKVLCSRCCNLRAKLAYLNKEDRICHPCFEILSSTSQNENTVSTTADSQSSSSCGSSPNFSPSPQIPNADFGDKSTWRPHPNNPDDYCSTIPPLQQIQLSGTRPPPTVMVPIGVLKRGNKPRREPKQVIFSDGIRPGGDLTDLTEPVDAIPAYRRMGRKRVEKFASGDSHATVGSSISCSASQRSRQKRILVSDEEGPLPPIVLQIDNEKHKDDKLDWNQVLERMQDDTLKPINFAILKNMNLFVKLTKLDCCYGKECWCFTSHGLCAVGQDEVMVILERHPGENTLPRGIIKLFTHIYDSASKGTTFEDLGHTIFPEQILGTSDHRGFLFVRPTFQCLSKLIVPNSPFLVAILIHKWEVPWAKVFPLRLMLRLGAECRYYPCALVSVRQRKPVFFEIGQTIMSVLADLRNYQFTIPVIPGLVVHMEEKKTCVSIPRNRYEKVMKVLNSNNVEHVLALGSNFSSEADSHLVCMQKEEGDYQTQAINIENTTRRVTGASFIVFSGALKSSSGLSAKFSIVEDGLLVQIPQEIMVNLHLSLREMKDMTIECGQINAAEPEEVVIIQWTRDDKKINIGVRSFIDGRSLEGIPSLRLHTSTDYAGDNHLIRWTEVFFLEVDSVSSSIQHEMVDPCRLAETVAQSCCMALVPFLDQLAEAELTKIGLRVTLDADRDRVEYDIGSRGRPLPATYMNALDSALIPVILRLSGSAQSEPISFELIFYVLIK